MLRAFCKHCKDEQVSLHLRCPAELRLQISFPRPPSRRFGAKPNSHSNPHSGKNMRLGGCDRGGDATRSPRCASAGGKIRRAAGGTAEPGFLPSPTECTVLRERTPKVSSPKAAWSGESHGWTCMSAHGPAASAVFPIFQPCQPWKPKTSLADKHLGRKLEQLANTRWTASRSC